MKDKRTIGDLAIFGGRPMFERPRSTGQLSLSDPEQFIDNARKAFEARRLSNNGSLVQLLESRLATWHQVEHCVAFANACFGIMLALESAARHHPGGEVILPSFTYRGLPHLIRWAGLTPRYVEVEEGSHVIKPQAVAEAVSDRSVAVLAVNNVNALCEVGELEAISSRNELMLLIDSVYAQNGRYDDGRPVGTRGRAEIFSVHATKLLNGFEGGYLTTDDSELAARLAAMRNFGFLGDRSPAVPGLNGKLNELHAGMALANLDGVDAVVQQNRRRLDAYRSHFAGFPGLSIVDYSKAPENYGLVLMEIAPECALPREALIALLRAENALVRPYNDPPLHRADLHIDKHSRPSLPRTDALARRYLQMPVGAQTLLEDIEALAALFDMVLRNAGAIRERMQHPEMSNG